MLIGTVTPVGINWKHITKYRGNINWNNYILNWALIGTISGTVLQCRSAFQSSTLIGRAVTRSQTSLGVRARFRLGFRVGYDVFRMYAVLILTNQIRALKNTPG